MEAYIYLRSKIHIHMIKIFQRFAAKHSVPSGFETSATSCKTLSSLSVMRRGNV